MKDRTEVGGEPVSACTESSESRQFRPLQSRAWRFEYESPLPPWGPLFSARDIQQCLVSELAPEEGCGAVASCLPWSWMGALDVVRRLSTSKPCLFPPVTPSSRESPAGHSVRLPPARSHFRPSAECSALSWCPGFAWSFDDSAASL